MLLAIDIGNSTCVVGFFQGDKLLYTYSIRTDYGHSISEISSSFSLFLKDKGIKKEQFEGAILSSVVPSLEKIWVTLMKSEYGVRVFVLGPKLKTGLLIKTENPKEVGADLIADAVKVKDLYGKDTLIVDMGTANKIILLGSDGSFEGCTIGVGLGISAKALASGTSLLPEVNFDIPSKVLGRNTADSMNSALTYGVSEEIKGLCALIEKEVGRPLKRVLTGGYARYVLSLLPEFDYYPTLLLEGLKLVYERNARS